MRYSIEPMLGIHVTIPRPYSWRVVTSAILIIFVCLGKISVLAEPLSVAGSIAPALSGTTVSEWWLWDQNHNRTNAGLVDPLMLLNEGSYEGILEVETGMGLESNGLPILKVAGVAPAFWAQPSGRSITQKGPAAFSGFHTDEQPKDFAGTPFTETRAYDHDNGFSQPLLTQGIRPIGPGPAQLQLLRGREIFTLAWNIEAGFRYELGSTTSVEKPGRIFSDFVATNSQPFSISITDRSPEVFFILRVSSP